jgi:hypothetical protein
MRTFIVSVAAAALACGSSVPAPKAILQGSVLSTAGVAMPGVHATVGGSTATTDSAGQFSLQLESEGPATLELSTEHSKASVAIPSVGKNMVVRVAVRMSDDGDAEMEHEPEAELEGTIDSLAAPDLVVGGHAIHTDAQTTFRIGGAAGSFADLEQGEQVEVEGTQQPDGSILASEIKTEDENEGPDVENEVELRGAVSAISGADLTVAGHLVHTNAMTSFDGDGASSLADIKVNAVVEVRGSLETDGSILASRVKLDD